MEKKFKEFHLFFNLKTFLGAKAPATVALPGITCSGIIALESRPPWGTKWRKEWGCVVGKRFSPEPDLFENMRQSPYIR